MYDLPRLADAVIQVTLSSMILLPIHPTADDRIGPVDAMLREERR
jgi:hypothetical protein